MAEGRTVQDRKAAMAESHRITGRGRPERSREPAGNWNRLPLVPWRKEDIPFPVRTPMRKNLGHRLQQMEINRATRQIVDPCYAAHASACTPLVRRVNRNLSSATAPKRISTGSTGNRTLRSEERRVGKECKSRWAPRQ